MIRFSSKMSRRYGQQGYAILLVLFFVALLFITAMSVVPNILTQGRRERETEMIWRGKQYIRGIKLYYRKTGKFPTSLDDLTKPQVGNIRFMRQAYKDPTNKKDGEWRLIYIGPTGQLIGSLNPNQRIQLGGMGMVAAVPGVPAAQAAAQSSAFGQTQSPTGGNPQTTFNSQWNPFGKTSPQTSSSLPTPAPTADPASAVSADVSVPAGTSDTDESRAANEALLDSEPTTVMGGKIIGVGGTIKQRSLMVYEKAKYYKQFEFIWDPSKDPITIGGAAGAQIGTPAGTIGAPIGQPNSIGNAPGQNPNNPNSPNAPLNPPPSPPETAPNSPLQP